MAIEESYVLFTPYEYIEQDLGSSRNLGIFIGMWNSTLYYYKIKGEFATVESGATDKKKQQYSIVGKRSGESCIPIGASNNVSIKTINNISFNNAYLLVDYVFLDDVERRNFENKKHHYMIETVDSTPSRKIDTLYSSINLTFNHPCKMLIWKGNLDYLVASKNYFTYTDDQGEPMIDSVKLTTNGIDRIQTRSSQYHQLVQTFQHFVDNTEGIYAYVFSIDPKVAQPMGHCNFSQIDDIYLNVQMNKIINTNNPFRIKVYAKTYNVLVIENGTAHLLFIN